MNKTALRVLKFSTATLAAGLTACAGTITTGLVPSPSQPHPALAIQQGATVATQTTQAGTGEIVMHINWPARYKTQVIPQAAQEIDISVASSSISPSPVATTSAVWPVTTATLSALAAGPYTLSANAYQLPNASLNNSTKTLVASATGPVTVAANKQTSANITMTDATPPSIASVTTNLGTNLFWSPNGTLPSNLQLLIKGTGLLGFGVATPTVFFTSANATGSIVTSSYGGGSSQDLVQVLIPSGWDGTGQVKLTVDGLSSSYSPGLVIVSTASLSPLAPTVAHATGSVTLTASASATGSAWTQVPAADFNWGMQIYGTGADISQMAQCGVTVGSFMDPTPAGTPSVQVKSGVSTATYYASTSIPIPDSSPCTVNGTSVTFNKAQVQVYVQLGGSTVATTSVTIN